MKFYYINNSFCERCDDCPVICPSGAVYMSGGKKYITHDKCTSCGVCIMACAHNAVSIESVDAMVEKMENADLYLSRIRRLEQELSLSTDKLERAEKNINSLLETFPSAAAICDARGNIILTNSRFAAATGLDCKEDVHISAVFSETMPSIAATDYLREEEAPLLNLKIRDKDYSVFRVNLEGDSNLIVLDDLTQPRIAASRISGVLEKAIVRQMETVRKIGTILGDGTSLCLNDLNRALDLLENAGGASNDIGKDN